MLRGFATCAAAAIVSGFIAGVVQMLIGIAYNAHEELILFMVGQVVLTLFAAFMFAVAMAASGSVRAIDLTAGTLIAVIVVGLAALEGFALSTEPAPQFARDIPVLVEIGIPALLAIAIQWRGLRRHIIKRARSAPAAA